MKLSLALYFLFSTIQIFGKLIHTFYGEIEVNEPVLLELIESAPMQRLKKLHQYGVSYYTTHPEEFDRYDHSLGVFAILRMKGASLDEQIAGLLHDVSHTVFSHVGDYFFNTKDSIGDEIYSWYLKTSGLESILQKHGIVDVNPKSGKFKALEQELPALCADRIDYNLQGAFHQGFLTREEVLELLSDLSFVDQKWIGTKTELFKKMGRFSLFMTENCWSSPENAVSSHHLCQAIRRGIEIGIINSEEIYFGTDDDVWKRLSDSQDLIIQLEMKIVFNPKKAEPVHYYPKFRGIDPWILWNGEILSLTTLNEDYATEFCAVKNRLIIK